MEQMQLREKASEALKQEKMVEKVSAAEKS